MGAKGKPKTGGAVKGSKHKTSIAGAQVKEIIEKDGNPLEKAVTWLNRLHNKTKPNKDDEKTMIELLKIVLPFTNRKQPMALEADVKANMTVLMMPGDEKL